MNRHAHASPDHAVPARGLLATATLRAAVPDSPVPEAVWQRLAESLGVDVAALHAIAEVESAGRGYLPSGRPKILFEGHVFHRLTGGRFSAGHPDISYPKWDKRKYKGGEAEWTRLEKAFALDREAALKSASWGLFQIMGFNHRLCGCDDVESFVSEEAHCPECQLRHFARFIARPPYLRALGGRKNWAAFARAYNGPGYAKNRYDTRLAAAYARWCTSQSDAEGHEAKPATHDGLHGEAARETRH